MSPIYKYSYDDSDDYENDWALIRLKIVLYFFVLLFLCIAARSFYIQVISSKEIVAYANKQNSLLNESKQRGHQSPTNNIVLRDKLITSVDNNGNYINLLTKNKNAYDITMLALTAVPALFVLFQLFSVIYPVVREKYINKLLINTLGVGPFDKETIRRATKSYVPTKCMDTDPCNNDEILHALSSSRVSLLKKVDTFIKDNMQKYLMIFADSGMGKTTFVLNYYAYNSSKSTKNRLNILLLPLSYSNLESSILSQHDPHNCVIILDGLDEDTNAIDNQQNRLDYLFELTNCFKKVIITCRTQFFSSDNQIPSETSFKRFGPRSLGSKPFYSLPRVYISPFDDKDIKLYLNKYYSIFSFKKKSRIYNIINKIPYLNVRPMLLTYLPDTIQTDISFSSTASLYSIIISAWLDRDCDTSDNSDLLLLSEDLAVNIYINRDVRGIEAIQASQVKQLSDTFKTSIENWRITGRSLLNRDNNGNYKFAHRSIMEYLFVKSLFNGNSDCLNKCLTDLMMRFILEIKCKEWPLDNELIRFIVKKRFVVNSINKTVDAIISKTVIAHSIKSLIDKCYIKPSDMSYNNNLNMSDIVKFIDNKAILYLLRDLSLSLVGTEYVDLSFDPNRSDAFWFKSGGFKLTENIINTLDNITNKHSVNSMPNRELVGVVSLLYFLDNNIGLNMLSAVINLSQNEIFVDYDNYNNCLLLNIYIHELANDLIDSENISSGAFQPYEIVSENISDNLNYT